MTVERRAGGDNRAFRSVVGWTWCAAILAISWLAGLHARAAVDLVLAGTDSPDPVVTQSNLTYTLTITNTGTTAATDVLLTNLLSPYVNFVSVTSTRGGCSHLAGIVSCDWNTVNPGSGGRVTIVARPIGPGIITNVLSGRANEVDANPANNLLTLTTTAVNRRRFSSTDFIQVQDVVANAAFPYPSTITVSGLTAAVQKVTVTLTNMSHTSPDDLDILLVGPRGGYIMLYSDGQTDPPLVDVIVTFDDAAAQPVPDGAGLVNGTYRAANYGNVGPDILPAPAPPGPHHTGFTNLAIFNGTDPNGDWRLFVYDDEPEAGGWIDGWSLSISTMIAMANLGVSVIDSPDPALHGDTITYTATITNMGPTGATGVRLTNQIPAALELISYSVTRGSCTNEGRTIHCDIGALDVGGSEQLVVQARVLNGGNHINRTEVTSDQVDPQPANNVALPVTTVEPRVDVVLGMRSSRTPALLEQPLSYTLNVTNFGPDLATNVIVVDQLPPGVQVVNMTMSQGSCSNQNGTVTCHLGDLTNGARATVLLTCRPTVLGPITNVASVTSHQVDTNLSNNSAQNENTVEPAADLQLSMTDAPDPVPLSRLVTYSIVLTNRGPSVSSNIVISDVLPASFQFVSAQTSHGTCTNDGNAVSCVIGELPVGGRVDISIMAIAGSVGTFGNTATVTNQTIDPNILNNTVALTTTVIFAVDLSVSKVGDRELIWEGDRLSYDLVVSNQGPSTATGARLNDSLPPGTSFVSANASTGSCGLQSGELVVCSLNQIAPGGFVTVSIVVRANAAGVITNTANAMANEQDLNPSNNSAVVTTTVIPRTATVADTNAVVLPEVGPASAYPLTINISGMTAAVQRVRVTLAGLSHSYPDDLDVLLVGPGGQAIAVMSDAGGSNVLGNADVTLDDLAPAVLPDSSRVSQPSYRPRDYEIAPAEFPAPAPPGPYASSFDAFTGTDPNGIWKLYIVDDATKDHGSLASGWRLDIWARDPLADLALAAQVAPDLVAVGAHVTMTVVVTNTGPGVATGVMVTNEPGAGLAFSNALPTQGNCTNEAGVVRCAFGDLAPGGSASVQLVFAVNASGIVSNAFGVAASSIDLNASNNTSVVSFAAENGPTIVTQPRNQFVPAGGTATFEAVASGDGLLSYQWYYNDGPIPDGTNATLIVTDVQLEKLGNYQLQVSNRVAVVLSDVVLLGFPGPPVFETIADQLMGEDETLTVPLFIMDPDNPMEAFQFSAVCDDTNLVPATNFSFTVSGTNYAMVIVPGTNQWGTNIVTVTVTDSVGLAASRAFILGVESINDYPQVVPPVGDHAMQEDSVLDIYFMIEDVETPAEVLLVGARSFNPILVPNIGVYGTGSTRLLQMRPADNHHGETIMELRVRDEAGVRTTNLFRLTVLPVEDPPTISHIDDVTILEDGLLQVTLSIGDVETAVGDLRLSASSSNTDLFSNAALVFEGDGSLRTMRAQPIANQYGESRITVFVEDEAGMVSSNAFLVTVDPVNDGPFVSAIPTVVTTMDQTSAEVPFTVSDPESEPDSLTFTAISTNTALAPVSGIEFGGSGSNRTVRVTPGPGQFGWTVLRVDVSDADGGITSREFELFVHQTNGPPAILRQPESQIVTPGMPATLRVVATGPGALSFLWRHDDVDLPDQTNAVLTIASAVGADRGQYRAVVTNSEGSTTSEPAEIEVIEPTRILTIRRVGVTAELTFRTITGQKYFVEFQDSLGTAWTPLPEVIGTGKIITVTDPAAAGNSRFYRIHVE